MINEKKSAHSSNLGVVGRIGPTHAKGLRKLVGLHASLRQGELSENVSLDFELSCGIAPLSGSKSRFELVLRNCFLQVSLENCDILGSRYECWLDPGSYAVSEAHQKEFERSSSIAAKLGGVGDALGSSTGIVAKILAGFSRKRSLSTESTVRRTARIGLVLPAGQDRWAVGDPILGDARQESGILSGTYFRELAPSGDDQTPLCILNKIDPAKPVVISLTVSAPLASTMVRDTSNQELRNANIHVTRSTTSRWTKQVLADHFSTLRSHIAGLSVAKQIRLLQISRAIDISDGEYVIAQQSLIFPYEIQGIQDQNPELPALTRDVQSLVEAIWSIKNPTLPKLIKAGGLNAQIDFQNMDFRGWQLGEEDVRGIDFTGSDLRGTGIENATQDDSTILEGAMLDSSDEGRSKGTRQYELVERLQQYQPKSDDELINRSYVYAMKALGNQTLPNGSAMFNQGLSIASILIEMKADHLTVTSSLLAESITDDPKSRLNLGKSFGPQVATGAHIISRLKKYISLRESTEKRITAAEILADSRGDSQLMRVILAYRLFALRSAQVKQTETRAVIAEETLTVFVPIAGVLGLQRFKRELEELSAQMLQSA